jgi:hypothetical protein
MGSQHFLHSVSIQGVCFGAGQPPPLTPSYPDERPQLTPTITIPLSHTAFLTSHTPNLTKSPTSPTGPRPPQPLKLPLALVDLHEVVEKHTVLLHPQQQLSDTFTMKMRRVSRWLIQVGLLLRCQRGDEVVDCWVEEVEVEEGLRLEERLEVVEEDWEILEGAVIGVVTVVLIEEVEGGVVIIHGIR